MATKPLCLIIGAGAGVGMANARKFGANGYALVLAARRKSEMERLCGELQAEGIEASAQVIDAGKPEDVATAAASLGAVDVMIYNAAGVSMATPMALTPDQLVADLNVSVISALAAAQAVAPAMIKAGRGSILLTGGGFALRPMAAMASLGIGKAAIRNLAWSLAEELGPKGIRVGTVTILGIVKPGTALDPAAIAEAFWQLHADRLNTLGIEIQFTGQ
ncbi:MAG: SDR family NAD(P)-dependent oxidoreductase [Beijerinckiaceae bacterium]